MNKLLFGQWDKSSQTNLSNFIIIFIFYLIKEILTGLVELELYSFTQSMYFKELCHKFYIIKSLSYYKSALISILLFFSLFLCTWFAHNQQNLWTSSIVQHNVLSTGREFKNFIKIYLSILYQSISQKSILVNNVLNSLYSSRGESPSKWCWCPQKRLLPDSQQILIDIEFRQWEKFLSDPRREDSTVTLCMAWAKWSDALMSMWQFKFHFWGKLVS